MDSFLKNYSVVRAKLINSWNFCYRRCSYFSIVLIKIFHFSKTAKRYVYYVYSGPKCKVICIRMKQIIMNV